MEALINEMFSGSSKQLFNIPTCPHDEDINTIATYKFVPYREGYGPRGLLMRAAELYASSALVNKINSFNDITGYRFALLRADEHEQALIESGFNDLIEKMQESIREKDIRKSDLSRQMNNVSSGKAQMTGGEIRDEVLRIKETIKGLTSGREKVEERLTHIVKIKNLISEYFACGDESMNTITVLRCSPSIDILKQQPACDAALNSLFKLENAFNSIISKCRYTPATGRFKKTRIDESLINSHAARFYFSMEGNDIRNCMSFSQYLSLQGKYIEAMNKKVIEMSSDMPEFKI